MFEPILPVMLASSIVAHSGCVCVVYTGPWWLDRESRDGNSETSLTNSAFYLAYFGYFPDYFGLFRHTKVVSAAALALLTMAQSKRQRRCICGITGYHWGGRCSRCSRCCRAERFWCEIVRYPTVSHCISRTSGYIRLLDSAENAHRQETEQLDAVGFEETLGEFMLQPCGADRQFLKCICMLESQDWHILPRQIGFNMFNCEAPAARPTPTYLN